MNKKLNYIYKISITLFCISIICIDLLEVKDFGIDRLFYKVKPLFADLITIIPSIEELNILGSSTKIKISSTETMNRAMNYPLLWVYIFDFFGKFTDPYKLFGYGQIFIYFSFLGSYLIKIKKNFLLTSLVVFSPPILLIFDRGNNDLFIFFLVFLSIYKEKIISGFLFGLASALKIYPLFLFPFILFYKRDKKKFIIGFLFTIPIIIISFSQLNIFLGNTAISFSSSFGILATALFFKKILSIFFSYDLSIYFFIIFSLFLFVSQSFILNFFFKSEIKEMINKILKNNKNSEIFILFTILSLFIFAIFCNWAYRIIFLLPSICIIINSISFNNRLLQIKEIIVIIILTFPFTSTWFLFSNNEILLNHYSWALYAPIVFISMSLYFLILLAIIRLKIKINYSQ